MNRRGFLQTLAAGLAATQAPFVMSDGVGRGVLMPVRNIWIPGASAIEWHEQLFDWGSSFALAGGVVVDGERYRHAVRLMRHVTPSNPVSQWERALMERQLTDWFRSKCYVR